MNRVILALAVVASFVLFGQRTAAQTSLSFSLFERYLESLRELAGVPGMSAVVLQNGVEVWSRGFGRADLESGTPAAPHTPYMVGGLSQVFGATLLLKECVEEHTAELNDPVRRWLPGYPDTTTRLWHLLAHVGADGSFRYDRARFSALTGVIEECADTPYGRLLAHLFSQLAMTQAVPGSALAAPTTADVETFGGDTVARYAAVLGEIASPYRLDRGRAVRTEVPLVRADAAGGVVASAIDLARFDAAVSLQHDEILQPATLAVAWQRPAPHLPTGLGWFVQQYNGERIVWQFGQVSDAYSSLIVKVPDRQLTFILLANSDALATPFAREVWDVTASAFARVFLLIFVP